MRESMIKAVKIILVFGLLTACTQKEGYASNKYRSVDGVSVDYSIESDKARSVINFINKCSNSNCVTGSENYFGWMNEPINIRYITIFRESDNLPISYEVGVEPEEKIVVVLRLQKKDEKDSMFDVSVSSLQQLD